MHNIVNHFRKNILDLEPLNRREATNVLIDERVPHTYCWSTALAPKPSDWESHINVSGFFFLDLGTTYTNPPQDLLDFLGISNNHHDNQKFPPIYIGFGSITGHDSRHILEVVVDALTKTGYRALLSGLATDSDHLPDNILKIGNVPHDWLFQYGKYHHNICHRLQKYKSIFKVSI
jgi:UDP:flavonoid glycosyltransferase YjiC (YdhE family)